MSIFQVAREEWYLLRRSPVTWLSLLVFALLAWWGVSTGIKHTNRLEQGQRFTSDYNATQVTKTRAAFARLNTRTSSVDVIPWHAGIIAYELMPQVALETTPLTPIAIGQSDLYPVSVIMRTRLDTVTGADEIENPIHLLTGSFDLAFVIVYLLPLLILCLSYDTLAGEREQGTLALALSQGTPLRNLIMGKLLLRFLLISGVACLVPIIGLLLSGRHLGTVDASVRLLLLCLVTLLYTQFWFAVVLIVGARARRSAATAVTVFGIWIGLVIVLPSLVATVIATAYPPPARLTIAQTVRTATDSAEARGEQLLQDVYEAHPEYRPKIPADSDKDIWISRYAVELEVEQTIQPLLQHFDEQIIAQQRLGNQLEWLSPALQVQTAFNEIAGTSERRYTGFNQAINGFRMSWRRFFLPRIFRRESVPDTQWNQLPKVPAMRQSASAILAPLFTALFGLAVTSLILWVVGMRCLARYRMAE